MATRSRIGIKNPDGSIICIYCHNDGYFEYNGRLLLEFHNSEEAARALVREGDMSVLGETIGEKHPFDLHDLPEFTNEAGRVDWDKVNDDPRSKYCRFYARDRGDTGCEALEFKNIDKMAYGEYFEEYLYLWDVTRNEWIACATPWKISADHLEWHRLIDIAAANYAVVIESLVKEYGPEEAEGKTLVEKISFDPALEAEFDNLKESPAWGIF